MNKTSKQIIGTVAISALVIGLASGVFARGGFGPGWGGHHGMMNGPMGYGTGYGHAAMMMNNPTEYTEQQLANLKSKIGITVDQETAWNDYVNEIKAKTGLMQVHRQTRFENRHAFQEQQQNFHQQGLAQMQKVFAARKNLSTVLTPEQQAKVGNLIGINNCF
ncbi:MAG: Spy/CpxP family protein refolding chaperone [gamma proteobacterium symbiont of Taylorina sp.]|nr:Spy/CpxP family protein refolding chaperone [gamma proteobacterium symbiont of Taylorina sp.]